jgi:hypothetical protein
MAVVTLISVFLGVTVRWPLLGLGMAIVCVPAFVRTVIINARRKAAGHGTSLGEKLVLFYVSLCVVLAVGEVSGLTFAFIMLIFALIDALRHATGLYLALFVAICVSGFIGWVLLKLLSSPPNQ